MWIIIWYSCLGLCHVYMHSEWYLFIALNKALLIFSFNIGIKHGFSCINIRQVLWEVLKTKAGGRSFQHFPRDLENVNALKNHVQSLLLHKKLKTFATFCVISCTIFFSLFTNVSQTQFQQTMLVLGPGITHLVRAANLWPRYYYTEICVAVH